MRAVAPQDLGVQAFRIDRQDLLDAGDLARGRRLDQRSCRSVPDERISTRRSGCSIA
jgi:hypothetical protein